MLHIHFANRIETLADALADRVGAAHGSAFTEHPLIVPSAALQRWLTLRLARGHGICAGVRFDYLARWLWRQVRVLVPEADAESPLDAAALPWRVYAAFGDPAWTGAHPRLARWLQQADPAMRFELAIRVAALFGQYGTYRPDWLAAWSHGAVALGGAGEADRADHDWQAALWRRVCGEPGSVDPIEAFGGALALLDGTAALRAGLPQTVHVFALPDLPPLHLGLLQALAGAVDVHLYALNPCREYWFDVVDRRRLAWLSARSRGDHHEEGHRLLAAWGRQTQAQLALLVDAAGDAVLDDACFTPHPGDSLLAQLQNSILELAGLAPGSLRLAASDRSVEIHVCHSLTREVEVLHDRLLGLFAAAPGALQPGDVVVVTPDLDAAAPTIDAVFGTAPPERHIPYTVTGRARSAHNPVARALLEVLRLATSRCTVGALCALLQQPLVGARFGLDAADLEPVRRWLQEAGVHWALDAEHRSALGLPALSRHTLADGLDRLLLGYALPARPDAPFHGRLPAGDAEGSTALALGALWRFSDALGGLRRRIAAPQPAADWPALLAGALDDFVAPRDAEPEDLDEVREALDALAAALLRGGLTEAVPVQVVQRALARALDAAPRGGVPTGRVTFSAMSSLRGVPFKVVCAIGLNDGALPGRARAPEFDLMALRARPGDRQRRLDERNVFLDLLLAARECLHLSCVGRSVHDNALLPPSVVVSELLDAVLPALGDGARGQLVVEHPLQPFSEAAFRVDGDPRLRSFQREHAEALQRRAAAPPPPPGAGAAADGAAAGDGDEEGDEEDHDVPAALAAPFVASPLAAPAGLSCELALGQLARFFRNPCRYLLERRIGIELRRDEAELQDDEPFLPDVPGRSALAARLLPLLLQGAGIDAARAAALAGTEVPAGALGRRFLERELAGLQGFAARVADLTRQPCVAAHEAAVELEAAGQRWRLHAALPDLRPSGLVRWRYDDARPADRLDAWLHHLMLCADPPPGVEPVTVWQARDGRSVLRRCADPHAVLRRLLALYLSGQREPLAFFPKAAWAYVDRGDSLSAARTAWQPSARRPYAEGADPACRLALRGRPDPLAQQAFHDNAHAVFDPLLECLEVHA